MSAAIGSLHEMTRYHLKNRRCSMTYRMIVDEIADNCNNCITVAWLEKFATCRLALPDVDRVQKLYEHLTGTKLIDS